MRLAYNEQDNYEVPHDSKKLRIGIATQVLAGIIGNQYFNSSIEKAVQSAFEYTDELIKQASN